MRTWLPPLRKAGRPAAPAFRAFICALFIGTLLSPPVNAVDPPLRWDLNVERTYYDQFRLVDQAVRGLEPQRPGVPDLYFVGFAGYASEDVFLREMTSVRRLFESRFDTAGRSLVFVNNPATVNHQPLANGHNLLAALEHVGRRMNREEDVLFLFLTSHGEPDRIIVDFPPLRLNHLSAADLRYILDTSGIKWRIIVISACYSGSFIDTLKTEHSLIITASRRDRMSFGCSHENDFTYFGRAFFDQALRHTFSFLDAFTWTAETVRRWETSEALARSEPQLYLGSAIRPKLAALENRLISLHGEATPSAGNALAMPRVAPPTVPIPARAMRPETITERGRAQPR